MTTELQEDSSLVGKSLSRHMDKLDGVIRSERPNITLVEQIAALKKATAARLVDLAAERKRAIDGHRANLQRIDDEVAALAPKQTRNRKPKVVVA